MRQKKFRSIPEEISKHTCSIPEAYLSHLLEVCRVIIIIIIIICHSQGYCMEKQKKTLLEWGCLLSPLISTQRYCATFCLYWLKARRLPKKTEKTEKPKNRKKRIQFLTYYFKRHYSDTEHLSISRSPPTVS